MRKMWKGDMVPMTLGDKRREFTRCLGMLLEYVRTDLSRAGYECYLGDVTTRNGHCDGSYHYQGLAADIHLFRDKVYLRNTEDHTILGRYWKELNPMCTWGGDFKKPDGNHYSFGEGKRF